MSSGRWAGGSAPTWSSEPNRARMSEHTPSPPSAHVDETRLVAELRQALRDTIFDSGLNIAPRRTNPIAQEIATSYLQFLTLEDGEACRTYGQRLAREGLGHRSILSMTEALRRVCWESQNPGIGFLAVTGRFANALLLGYMAEREAVIHQEQERTFRATKRSQGDAP